ALAGHAIACLRAWFMPAWDQNEPDWGERARVAVETALAGASELAETHLAAAMHAVQHGEYKQAAEALRQALRIAPTYTAAHEYLGRLQIEAGRPNEGVAHLELALQLDPSLSTALPDIGRYRALRGDLAGFDAIIQQFLTLTGRDNDMPTAMLEIRVGAWHRDPARMERGCSRLSDNSGSDGYAIGSFARMMSAPELDRKSVVEGK